MAARGGSEAPEAAVAADEAGGSSAEAMFEKIMGDSEGFEDFVIPPREGTFRPVDFG